MDNGADRSRVRSPALSECETRVAGAMATPAPGFAALNTGLRVLRMPLRNLPAHGVGKPGDAS
jgi:hypothetical protein